MPRAGSTGQRIRTVAEDFHARVFGKGLESAEGATSLLAVERTLRDLEEGTRWATGDESSPRLWPIRSRSELPFLDDRPEVEAILFMELARLLCGIPEFSTTLGSQELWELQRRLAR